MPQAVRESELTQDCESAQHEANRKPVLKINRQCRFQDCESAQHEAIRKPVLKINRQCRFQDCESAQHEAIRKLNRGY